MISHSKTLLTYKDIINVLSTLLSGNISDNSERKNFEKAMCHYLGNTYAVATTSGTLALQLALKFMKIGGGGDEVLVPTFVCDDILSAVHQVGANAVPIDMDVKTFNINPEDAIARLTKKTKAMILVHMFGLPNKMEKFKDFPIPIIEDCAHSLGATWNKKFVGTFGHISTFSFHGLKLLTCGEGGMLMTNSQEIIQRHNTMLEPNFMDGGYRLDYHLSDILAKLGLSQLQSFPSVLKWRQRRAFRYSKVLNYLPQTFLPIIQTENKISSCFRYILRHKSLKFSTLEKMFMDRKIVIRRPVKNLLHRLLGLKDKDYPIASENFEHIFSIPFYPALTKTKEKTVLYETKAILG